MINKWIIFASIAMLVSVFSVIVHKYINIYNSKKNDLVLAMVFLFVGIFSLFYIIYNNKALYNFSNYKNFKKTMLLAILLSLIIIIYTVSFSYAVKISPKSCYCNLIVNFNIILTAFIGYFLFKEHLNQYSIVGLILCFFGLSLIIYNQNN
tara:strand:- start:1163 stop:1615 length:453 start_codon:yes stop_codon:yes gene_type:complete